MAVKPRCGGHKGTYVNRCGKATLVHILLGKSTLFFVSKSSLLQCFNVKINQHPVSHRVLLDQQLENPHSGPEGDQGGDLPKGPVSRRGSLQKKPFLTTLSALDKEWKISFDFNPKSYK